MWFVILAIAIIGLGFSIRSYRNAKRINDEVKKMK